MKQTLWWTGAGWLCCSWSVLDYIKADRNPYKVIKLPIFLLALYKGEVGIRAHLSLAC